MKIDPQGRITWSPATGDVGTHYVQVTVADDRGAWIGQGYELNVVLRGDACHKPVPADHLHAAARGFRSAHSYQYQLEAIDPDQDALIWSLETGPDSMSLDPQLGTLRWTPRADQVGIHNVAIQVADGQKGQASQSFSILVLTTNLPPQIQSTPSTRASVGDLYVYPVRATDGNNDPLTFSLASAPSGMTINAATGVVQWRPAVAQLGSHSVVVKVEDDRGGFVTQTYSMVVANATSNLPPVITSNPAVVATVDQVYEYGITAADPNGDPLSFALREGPAGMNLDAVSGLLQWTPSLAQVGSHVVILAAPIQTAPARNRLSA